MTHQLVFDLNAHFNVAVKAFLKTCTIITITVVNLQPLPRAMLHENRMLDGLRWLTGQSIEKLLHHIL